MAEVRKRKQVAAEFPFLDSWSRGSSHAKCQAAAGSAGTRGADDGR
jgi:hypothetical protein